MYGSSLRRFGQSLEIASSIFELLADSQIVHEKINGQTSFGSMFQEYLRNAEPDCSALIESLVRDGFVLDSLASLPNIVKYLLGLSSVGVEIFSVSEADFAIRADAFFASATSPIVIVSIKDVVVNGDIPLAYPFDENTFYRLTNRVDNTHFVTDPGRIRSVALFERRPLPNVTNLLNYHLHKALNRLGLDPTGFPEVDAQADFECISRILMQYLDPKQFLVVMGFELIPQFQAVYDIPNEDFIDGKMQRTAQSLVVYQRRPSDACHVVWAAVQLLAKAKVVLDQSLMSAVYREVVESRGFLNSVSPALSELSASACDSFSSVPSLVGEYLPESLILVINESELPIDVTAVGAELRWIIVAVNHVAHRRRPDLGKLFKLVGQVDNEDLIEDDQKRIVFLFQKTL